MPIRFPSPSSMATLLLIFRGEALHKVIALEVKRVLFFIHFTNNVNIISFEFVKAYTSQENELRKLKDETRKLMK
jgi:hypothetical protein